MHMTIYVCANAYLYHMLMYGGISLRTAVWLGFGDGVSHWLGFADLVRLADQ